MSVQVKLLPGLALTLGVGSGGGGSYSIKKHFNLLTLVNFTNKYIKSITSHFHFLFACSKLEELWFYEARTTKAPRLHTVIMY